MAKNKITVLQVKTKETEDALKKTNKKINQLGTKSEILYDQLIDIQKCFDDIRNFSDDKKLECEKLKEVRLDWKQQAEKLEKDYEKAVKTDVKAGAAGLGLGTAVVSMGPTAAMGVATTYGVASTGTAISSLSGAAAQNAALAWLGGGTLAEGGGGIVAGKAFLAMAGPVGWSIAGAMILYSGFSIFKARKETKRLEEIFTLICERDIKTYTLAIVELNERITRIIDETDKLKNAIEKIRSFGLDYDEMTEAQQYELGAYVNLMSASTQLIINPIMSLQPKYSEDDFQKFYPHNGSKGFKSEYKDIIIFVANFLYGIELSEMDKTLLWKTFRRNKTMLESLKISKSDFVYEIINQAYSALDYKYTEKQ